jgi:hypothetical protein
LVPTRRGFDILTNLSPNRVRITADKEESEKGITRFKQIGLAGINSYSGRVWVLSSRILAIGLAEQVHTRRPDRPATRAGWDEWATRNRGKALAGWASARISAHGQRKIENSFSIIQIF